MLLDPAIRRRLGQAARARAEAHFSWEAHCHALDAAIGALRDRTRGAAGGGAR